jgi:hypothetical protein
MISLDLGSCSVLTVSQASHVMIMPGITLVGEAHDQHILIDRDNGA